MIGIKDMCMPECCNKCPFYSGIHNGICLIEIEYPIGDYAYYERQEWCPLVEIESEDEDE